MNKLSVLNSIKTFEKNFDSAAWAKFMETNYDQIVWTSVAFYLISIYLLSRFMVDRPAYQLKKPLIIWNFLLFVFSFFGAVRFVPIMFGAKSLDEIMCSNYYHLDSPYAMWTALFTLSKPLELVDTYFLILRKRKVIFLHWYHHATVLIYSLLAAQRLYAGMTYVAMNYSVHCLMYGYYFIAATRIIKIPKFISKSITSLQILQMVAGIFVHVYLIKRVVLEGNYEGCHTDGTWIFYGSVMYASYFVLFYKYFTKTYSKKEGSDSKKKD